MPALTQVSCLCVCSVSIWPFQLGFLLFFPYFSWFGLLVAFFALCGLFFRSFRVFASLFWLVSMFSRLCLSCFRFRFRSRGFAICLSLLMFRFVWKLTLSVFIGKGKGSRNCNTTTGTCDITSTMETAIMEATMAAEA